MIIHSTLIHNELEKPSLIQKWIESKGFTLNLFRPFNNEKLPSSSELDCLIIMGGPQSILEIEKYPYLLEELNFIKEVIGKGKTVIGICLGAQLISMALGSKCEKSPHKEIGLFPVFLSQQAKTDPLLSDLPTRFQTIHWHSDMMGMTKNSTLLASSEGCPRQIVRFQKKVYGFQCHLEQSKKDLSILIKKYAKDITKGTYIQDPQTILSSELSESHTALFHILDRLLELDLSKVS